MLWKVLKAVMRIDIFTCFPVFRYYINESLPKQTYLCLAEIMIFKNWGIFSHVCENWQVWNFWESWDRLEILTFLILKPELLLGTKTFLFWIFQLIERSPPTFIGALKSYQLKCQSYLKGTLTATCCLLSDLMAAYHCVAKLTHKN